jgi:hypothetical protein
MLVVILLSLMPLSVKDLLGTRGEYHKWGHRFVFAVGALLLCLLRRQPHEKLVVAALAFGLAASIEAAQVLLFREDFEWRDLGSDALGILIGGSLAILIDNKRPD